jgi:nicotinamidase-related amidase
MEVIIMEAFLIIDMQEGYIGNRRGSEAFDYTLAHINGVSDLFRKAGKPVIVIRDISEGDTPEYKNVAELKVQEQDDEILKVDNNSFWNTTLHELLQKKNVDFIVMAGNAAEYCVTATYFGALERGYKVVLLQNGVLAATTAGLETINTLRPLISYSSLEHFL